MNRVAEVNRALKAAGHAEKLTRGRGYYYFRDGSAAGWYRSSVYVCRARELSVADWVREHADMLAEAKSQGRV